MSHFCIVCLQVSDMRAMICVCQVPDEVWLAACTTCCAEQHAMHHSGRVFDKCTGAYGRGLKDCLNSRQLSLLQVLHLRLLLDHLLHVCSRILVPCIRAYQRQGCVCHLHEFESSDMSELLRISNDLSLSGQLLITHYTGISRSN